jgi:hypothetical protein
VISHCPILYRDETVSSVIARYIDRMGYPSFKPALAVLFGRSTVTNVVDLPTNLQQIAELWSQFGLTTADTFINENTLWPFYAAFHTPDCRRSVRQEMHERGHPYLSLGLMASRGPQTKFLRYCPLCVRHDRLNLGETYWHREHQVPGVMVCARHGVELVESLVAYRHARNRHAFITAESIIPQIRESAHVGTLDQRQLARSVEWWLSHPSMHVPHEVARTAFIQLLISGGYALYSDRVFVVRLKNDVCSRFTVDFLRETGCVVDSSRTSWIESLLRSRSRTQHPLRYLVLAQFLSLEMPELAEATKHKAPFGRSPWPCLNKACSCFGTLTVTTCQIRRSWNSHHLIGTFHCVNCDMQYERTGPDCELGDRLMRTKLPVYGSVWDNRLRCLWNDRSVSLRSLCGTLGVDPRTAHLQALRLGLAPRTKQQERTQEHTAHEPAIPVIVRVNPHDEHVRWIELRRRFPEASITQLRIMEPALYMSLWRRDKQWLELNSPHRSNRPPGGPVRTDLDVRDSTIAAAIRLAGKSLLKTQPLVRLTRTALLREANSLWVSSKKICNMPKTSLALDANVESRVAFAVRKVNYAANDLRARGIECVEWRLVRTANLRPDLAKHVLVKNSISNALGVTNT